MSPNITLYYPVEPIPITINHIYTFKHTHLYAGLDCSMVPWQGVAMTPWFRHGLYRWKPEGTPLEAEPIPLLGLVNIGLT